MNATCERCGPSVRAKVIYTRGSTTWQWCEHHAREHHALLTSLGYVRREVDLSDLRDPGARAITGS